MTTSPPLRPERFELFPCEWPLVRPQTTRFGPVHSLPMVLIKITDKDGAIGWGEITLPEPTPFARDYLSAEALIVEKILGPFLCEKVLFQGPEAFDDQLDALPGAMATKAALSMAAYDIAAQKQGVSLASLIGNPTNAFPVCRRLTVPAHLPSLIDEAEKCAADGFRSIHLEISPAADLAPTLALRRALPQMDLRLTGNAAYAPCPDSMRLFYALDALDLSGLGQPFAANDLVDHARLQAALRMPVILAESIGALHDFEQAAALNSGRALALSFRRMGSLTKTRRLIEAAQKQGWGLLTSSPLEGFFGFQIALAFARHPAMTLPADVLDSAYRIKDFDQFWHQEPFHIKNGSLHFHAPTTALAAQIDLLRLLPRQKQAKSLKKAA